MLGSLLAGEELAETEEMTLHGIEVLELAESNFNDFEIAAAQLFGYLSIFISNIRIDMDMITHAIQINAKFLP